MTTERWLIVNADELGRSPGVNEGIVEAHRRGVVTSASALVRRGAAEAAAELVRSHPKLSVGLQVDLGESVYRDGRWIAVEEVVPLEDAEAVEREIVRQLQAFRDLFGKDPTHLDSQQDVHRTGHALPVLTGLARALGIPLRHLAPGIFVCSEFHGQTSRGFPYPQGSSVERLLALVEALPPGVTELICRPGRGADAGGMYRDEREDELNTLLDPRVREGIEAAGVALRSFRQIGRAGVVPGGSPKRMESSFRERGQEAFREGRFSVAQSWFEGATRVGGDRPWPWLWLARARLRTGDPVGSRTAAEKALSLVPGWPPAVLHLVDLQLEERQWAEAADLLAGLARRNEDGEANLAREIGQRIRRLQDAPQALRVATILAETHPETDSALAARAIALWRAGDPLEAKRFLSPRLRAPDGSGIRAAAELHLEVGEPDVAWRILSHAPTTALDGRLLARVALGLRRAGALTHAWEAFEEAVARGVKDRASLHWRDVVVGEIQVLSGASAPWVPPARHFRGVPGRVLHLVGRSLPYMQTGYSVRTRYVTLAQRGSGLDPHVVTQLGFPWADGVEEAPVHEELDGISHHRLGADDPIPARLDRRLDLNAKALMDLVRRLRPAAIHAASDYRNALLALAVGRACGIPVVYEVRGFWEDTWSSKQGKGAAEAVAYRWRRERELECMRRADRVVTLAGVMRQELMARGIPGGKIVVVPNAVDPAAFQPVDRDSALARELGIDPGEVVVGYVSSFVAYEGIRFLIEATARLARRGLPVRCLLVGDGEERGVLEDRARELGVEGRVVFTGRVPHRDVARYYGLIDVFVVPRTGHRVCQMVTPLKPYEAMAMERAVVVSGVQALREMVVPGKTGLVFHPEDPEHLADVLEPLIRSPERRRTLGRAARDWVRRHRTWTQNGDRYAELYRELKVLPAGTVGAGERGIPTPGGRFRAVAPAVAGGKPRP
jgi:PEP-CTERM/exosortase A-associated glycosyltransferase